MNTSTETKELYAAFVAAQADPKYAAFDKTNPHFKNKYASLASARDTITPALAKHGLAVMQVTEFGETFRLVTRMVHTSGQWVESYYPLDKAAPQQMGSGMTYARRYSLFAICGIVGDDDDDANAAQGAKPQNGSLQSLPPIHNPTKAATRSEKDILCGEINAINSMAVLKKWGEDNATVIQGLNEDFYLVVANSYKERVSELKAMGAA